MAAARSLAHVMADNKISLVYGGGTVGLMGELARTLVSLSGPESVHGIFPAPLVKYERGVYIISDMNIPRLQCVPFQKT
jgi:predicted Rossmann-fold nucleotide-binding protein